MESNLGKRLAADHEPVITLVEPATLVITLVEPATLVITLNSDGSVTSKIDQAVARGLIHDSQRHCLAAFSINLGIYSITRAELRDAVSTPA
ncbi:hypothetical protein LINPERPRIM_LOCUS387 [Linum perenne]